VLTARARSAPIFAYLTLIWPMAMVSKSQGHAARFVDADHLS